MTRTVWVVKAGPITQQQIDDGLYPQDALGLPEYQFSDGPAGQRGYSEDYYDLEVGLRDYSGCIIIYEEQCNHTFERDEVMINVCTKCGIEGEQD